MELVIESITGHTRTVGNVNSSETVRGLKTRLWKLDGVPIGQQSLIYRNQALDDEKTLDDYQVVDGAVLKLVLITRSGPINKTVEPRVKKTDMNIYSGSNSTEPRRNTGDGNEAAGGTGFSTLRRYTRQQMRQAQLAAADCVGGKFAISSRLAGHQPLSSDLDQHSSSSLLDLSFTPERQSAAARRADENLRTMQRMRELRRSIERLNLEKSQSIGGQRQAQRNTMGGSNVSSIAESGGQSRSRRPTGGTGSTATQANGGAGPATTGQRSRSSTQIVTSSSDRYAVAAAAAAARAAYAADDTSAKESSAGETEVEDAACYRELTVSNTTASLAKQAASSGPNNSRIRGQISSQHHLLPPPGFKSKHQLYRNIRRSSCSDVDVESSAVWSSDPEVDAVFYNDRSREELYTAEDWSLDDEEEWEGQKASAIADSSDYEDANGGQAEDTAQLVPPANARHSSSADDAAGEDGVVSGLAPRRNIGQDISSDPSELSSGVLVCELTMAMNSRRLKVKRKSYHTPRHGNKRTQQPPSGTMGNLTMKFGGGGNAVDETDDQSPLESPVKCGNINEGTSRIFPFRMTHHNANYRDQHFVHTGYMAGTSNYGGGGLGNRSWHRGRPRSKQRLPSAVVQSTIDQQSMGVSGGQQIMANNSTTTGDSSSDEREDASRRDSQAGVVMGTIVSGVGRGHKPPQSSQSQQRCNACACRLSVATTFQCRCGKTVCLRHRHADLHACTLLTAAAVNEKK